LPQHVSPFEAPETVPGAAGLFLDGGCAKLRSHCGLDAATKSAHIGSPAT
jgi:hypothetical protein